MTFGWPSAVNAVRPSPPAAKRAGILRFLQVSKQPIAQFCLLFQVVHLAREVVQLLWIIFQVVQFLRRAHAKGQLGQARHTVFIAVLHHEGLRR